MSKGYSLGTKLNILLLTVFVVGTLLTWVIAGWIARRQTEQDVAEKAQLLLKATESVRGYTSNDVGKILLKVQDQTNTFLPETVPAFSARTVFEIFRSKGYEEFFYKEASSNPTNVKDDKADAFEEGVLGALRQDPKQTTLSGYREDFGGQRRFFTAQAMRLTDASCLRCHSTPDQAPPEMVKLYGDKNGFNWQMNDVIAARVVYVPAGHVAAASRRSALFVTGSFVMLYGIVVGAINLLLRNGVLHPLRVLSDAAQAISKPGEEEETAEAFAQSAPGRALARTKDRGDELGQLADGFVTMAGEVRKREQGLRQAKSQVAQREAYFRALIENASVTYLILDSRYLVRYASPLVKKILGADPQEVTGKLFLHLVSDDNQRPLLDAVERAEAKKGTSEPFIFRRAMPDGQMRFIEAVVTNLLDQPAIRGLVIVLRDVTERKRLEELELQQKSGTAAGLPALSAGPGSAAATALAVPLGHDHTALAAPPPAAPPAPVDPVLVVQKLVETFPTLEPVQQQQIVVRLVAAGLATGAKSALPVGGIAAIRGKLHLPDTEAIDAGRLIELFLLLADFAVALDTLVWSTWKQLAPQSEVRRAGTGSGAAAGAGQMGLKKLCAAYLGADSTIPRGQVAYDLERSRALTAALIASIGQVGQEFAKRYRAKFAPLEIEKQAAGRGGGLLAGKDAKCWRAYRDLAAEMDEAKIEAEVLRGLTDYAESLLKSLR